MKSVLTLTFLLLTSSTLASTTLHCKQAFGESVYESFTLELDPNGQWDYKYDLSDLVGSEVILDGVMNENHVDNDNFSDEWQFVTLGKRSTQVRHDEQGYGFYIDTCKDCDFNSATYKYEKTSDSEIFITENYGSDGSSAFSVYSCSL